MCIKVFKYLYLLKFVCQLVYICKPVWQCLCILLSIGYSNKMTRAAVPAMYVASLSVIQLVATVHNYDYHC